MSGNACLAAALGYAKQGHYVLPLVPRQKVPALSDWKNVATNKPEIVQERFTGAFKDCQVGIKTGVAPGIFVLDADSGKGGEASLARLIAEHGPLPPTVKCLTGGGGYHLYFRMPEGREIRNAVAMGGYPGLDIRGEGGFVVAPPSVHESGRKYEWELGHGLGEIEIAEAPDALLAVIEASKNGRPARAGPAPTADEKIAAGRRNNTLTSLAGAMRRRGMGEGAIRAALSVENESRCDPPLPEKEVARVAQSVARYEPEEPVVVSDRPRIVITNRQDSAILEEARQALAEQVAGLYYRDSRLVALNDHELHPVGLGEAHALLANSARWVCVTRDGEKSTPVPRRLINALQESPAPPIQVVQRVMHVPAFVGEDFTLVTRPGFDPATQALYVGDAFGIEDVPGEPSAEDVNAAKAILDGWLEEFPFTDETARAHAVGLLITLVVRGAIDGRTPIFLIEAATPGTGKTILAEVMCLTAHGVPPVSTHYTRDGEEMGKRVASWVISGRPVAFLDNLSRITGEASHVLSSIVTTGSIEVRAMRELRAAGGRWDGVLIATGNNVQLSEEMPRRICRIRLDSPENPATRVFRRDDLHGWTLAHRPELVRAVAVLVAAWKAVGRPPGVNQRPSFVEWARTVGGILGCLDQRLAAAFLDPDDLENMMAFDEGSEDLRGLITAWASRPDALSARYATRDIVKIAEDAGVLERVLGDGSDRSRASRLGRYLKRQNGKAVAGHRLLGEPDRNAKVLRWMLVSTTEGV